MEDVIARLQEARLLPGDGYILGVPAVELDRWEHHLGQSLPADYRAFLERAGATKGARLLEGSTFFWPECTHISQVARDELSPEASASIPSHTVFVFEHQGYIFGWFDMTDPHGPVYVSNLTGAGERYVERIADSFRAFLLADVSHRAAHRRATSAVIEGESSVFPPTPTHPIRDLWRWVLARLQSRGRRR